MAMKFTVVAHKGSNESPAYIATHSTFEEAWLEALEVLGYDRAVIEVRDMNGFGDLVFKVNMHAAEYRPLLRPTEQMHEMLRAQPEECLETADQAAVDAGAWG